MADVRFSADNIEVVRSERRTRTVSAEYVNGKLRIRIPAHFTASEEKKYVEQLAARMERRLLQKRLNAQSHLLQRAQELNRQYFAGKLRITSVEYVTNQHAVFGSCSIRRGAVRLSHRLATVPAWVRDYVLLHELAHLLEPGHNRRFWRMVNQYPLAERARGYLMALGLEEAASEEVVDE